MMMMMMTAQSWKAFRCRIQAYFFCSSAMVDPESLRTGLLMTIKPSSRTSRMLSLMLASESFARSCLLLTLALPQTTPMTLYPIAAHDSITYSMKTTVTTMRFGASDAAATATRRVV